MQEPFLFEPERKEEYRQLMREANKHCIICNKPSFSKSPYCTRHLKSLKTTGLEDVYISFGKVGRSTINYQQHLHRKFFISKSGIPVNAHIDYRGNKEDRIKTNISKESIDISLNRLIRTLNTLPKYHKELYSIAKEHRNFELRMLYNLTLWYISYYIDKNTMFITEEHFKSQVRRSLFIMIERGVISKSYGKVSLSHFKRDYTVKQLVRLSKQITSVMEYILIDLMTE